MTTTAREAREKNILRNRDVLEKHRQTKRTPQKTKKFYKGMSTYLRQENDPQHSGSEQNKVSPRSDLSRHPSCCPEVWPGQTHPTCFLTLPNAVPQALWDLFIFLPIVLFGFESLWWIFHFSYCTFQLQNFFISLLIFPFCPYIASLMFSTSSFSSLGISKTAL